MSLAGAILLSPRRASAEARQRSVTELTPDWQRIGFPLTVSGGPIPLGVVATELVERSVGVPFPVDLDGA